MAKTFNNPLERKSGGTTASPAATATAETLLPGQIRRDGGTQMRPHLNQAKVLEYAELIEDGVDLGPIKVIYDGENHWMWDGFHRIEAHIKVHGKTVPLVADIQPGTQREAVLLATSANSTHGIERSPETKARAVDTLLLDEEWGMWGNREIARRTGTSHGFVAKRREILEAAGTLASTGTISYLDKHGNESTMNTSKITAANRARGVGRGAGGDLSGVEFAGVGGEGENEDEDENEDENENEGATTQDAPGTSEGSSTPISSLTPETPQTLRDSLALPADLLAFGWQLREIGNSGKFYAFRPRVGDLGARSTATMGDIAAVIDGAYDLQGEVEPDQRQAEIEDRNGGDIVFDLGPLLDVPALSSAAVEAIIRYNNSMTAAMMRPEVRNEIAAAMAAAQSGLHAAGKDDMGVEDGD